MSKVNQARGPPNQTPWGRAEGRRRGTVAAPAGPVPLGLHQGPS